MEKMGSFGRNGRRWEREHDIPAPRGWKHNKKTMVTITPSVVYLIIASDPVDIRQRP